jgi:cell division protein FtsB
LHLLANKELREVIEKQKQENDYLKTQIENLTLNIRK